MEWSRLGNLISIIRPALNAFILYKHWEWTSSVNKKAMSTLARKRDDWQSSSYESNSLLCGQTEFFGLQYNQSRHAEPIYSLRGKYFSTVAAAAAEPDHNVSLTIFHIIHYEVVQSVVYWWLSNKMTLTQTLGNYGLRVTYRLLCSSILPSELVHSILMKPVFWHIIYSFSLRRESIDLLPIQPAAKF